MPLINEVDIRIVERMDRHCTEIWVHEYHGDAEWNISIKDNIMVKTKIDPNEIPVDLTPFLSLNSHFAIQLFKSLAEYLSQKGIKTKDVNLIEGELTASLKHLEDLRKYMDILLTQMVGVNVK